MDQSTEQTLDAEDFADLLRQASNDTFEAFGGLFLDQNPLFRFAFFIWLQVSLEHSHCE